MAVPTIDCAGCDLELEPDDIEIQKRGIIGQNIHYICGYCEFEELPQDKAEKVYNS